MRKQTESTAGHTNTFHSNSGHGLIHVYVYVFVYVKHIESPVLCSIRVLNDKKGQA
jgi:hypothetical protein